MPPSPRCVSERTRDRTQWWCSLFFLCAVIVGLSFVVILHLKVYSKFDETRCKCVCPHNLKTTDAYNTTVFLAEVSEAVECKCENVVPLSLSNHEILCLQCQCTFETRNKLLLEVIIISVIVIVFAMLIYTLVYSAVQLLMIKTPRNRFNHQVMNENINHTINSTDSSDIDEYRTAFKNRTARDRHSGYK